MPSDSNVRRTISVPDGVLIRELDGESVLLNVNTEKYFGLNEVGTRMWAALARLGDTESACEALLEEFEVEPERLRSDLETLLGELVGHGLLVVHE
jgi:hypothetical protein